MRIGLAATLGGPRPYYRRAFLAAIDRLGALGADHVAVDDRAEAGCAARCAQALVAAGVQVVLGHFNSRAAHAAAAVYARHGIPLVLPACTDDALDSLPQVLRLCPGDRLQVRALADAAAAAGGCSVHAEPGAYGRQLAAALAPELAARRVPVQAEARAPLHVLLGHAPWLADWLDRRAPQLPGRRVLMCDEGAAAPVAECSAQLLGTAVAFLAPTRAYPELLAAGVEGLAAASPEPALPSRLKALQALAAQNHWQAKPHCFRRSHAPKAGSGTPTHRSSPRSRS